MAERMCIRLCGIARGSLCVNILTYHPGSLFVADVGVMLLTDGKAERFGIRR